MTTKLVDELVSEIRDSEDTPEIGYSGWYQEAAENHIIEVPTNSTIITKGLIALMLAIGVGGLILGIAGMLIVNA